MTNEALGEQIKGLVSLIEAQNKTNEVQFEGINSRLDKINGRIGKNEDKVNEIILNNATQLGIYKEDSIKHYINCPRSVEIKELSDRFNKYEKDQASQYADLNFFIRHPRVFVGILVVLVILTLGSLYQGYLTTKELRNKTFTSEQPIAQHSAEQSKLTYYVEN